MDDPKCSESPELLYPEFIRGRYVQMFSDVLLEKDHVILNLFDDVSLNVIRDGMIERGDNYTWVGSIQENEVSSLITITFGKTHSGVFRKIWVDGKMYVIESGEHDTLMIFEIDPYFFSQTTFIPENHLAEYVQHDGLLDKIGRIFVENVKHNNG